MDDILTFVAEHYLITALAACGFLIFTGIGNVDSQHGSKNFFWATICILLLMFAEIGEYVYSLMNEMHVMRIAYSVLAYMARPAIAYCIVLVPAKKRTPRLAGLLFIPLIINLIVVCSAFFCPLAFYFDEFNDFHRGPLGFVPFAVGGFYIVLFLYYCVQRIRRSEMTEAVISISSISICAVSVVVETTFNLKGALASVSFYLLLFYYMYLLMTRYSTDFLTGAYMRSHIYSEVEARECDRYYIIFDVNGLKRINDSEGHEAGDAALLGFSKAVHNCLPSTALFYRMGGDEFAVIYRTKDEAKVANFAKNVVDYCHILVTVPYGVSAGYSHFTGKSDFHDAKAVADVMLYENKRNYWNDYAEKHPDQPVEHFYGMK